MIDNRGLTVLAQVTVEEWWDSDWFLNEDKESLVALVEIALQEAFKRGCEDCRVKNFESDVKE